MAQKLRSLAEQVLSKWEEKLIGCQVTRWRLLCKLTSEWEKVDLSTGEL